MTKYAAVFAALFNCLPAAAQPALETLKDAAPAAELNIPEPRLGGGGSQPADVAGPAGFPAQAAAAYRYLPNYITLHAIPSPGPMNWTSVSSLALSFARNELAVNYFGQTNSIGHVSFEIGCTLPDGSRSFTMTGQSPVSMKGFTEQVKAGSGYGAFFGHVEGRLQTPQELDRALTRLSGQNGEVAFLTMRVSRDSCLEAARYMAAYRAEGVYTRYGLGARPLYAEGGGCANVGASVVEVAGPAVFPQLSEKWSRTIYLPKKLMGGPENHVGAGDIAPYLLSNWTKKPSYPSKTLFFYDPDLIYDWILAAHRAGASEGRPAARYAINKARGVLLDYSADTAPTAWWKTEGGGE